MTKRDKRKYTASMDRAACVMLISITGGREPVEIVADIEAAEIFCFSKYCEARNKFEQIQAKRWKNKREA